MSKIAYCPKCKNMKAYSNFSLNCKVCGSSIRGYYMDSSEWDTMSDTEKKEYLHKVELDRNKPKETNKFEERAADTNREEATGNSNTQNFEVELIEHLRSISKDLHFIKTVVLVYIVLSVIVALIIMVS